MSRKTLRPIPFVDLIVNRRVYWTDPDAGLCSGWGYIDAIRSDGEPVDAETVISVRKDDGGEVEALPHELQGEAVRS